MKMDVYAAKPYGYTTSVAEKAQRMAMHVGAKGFHGLEALVVAEKARRRSVLGGDVRPNLGYGFQVGLGGSIDDLKAMVAKGQTLDRTHLNYAIRIGLLPKGSTAVAPYKPAPVSIPVPAASPLPAVVATRPVASSPVASVAQPVAVPAAGSGMTLVTGGPANTAVAVPTRVIVAAETAKTPMQVASAQKALTEAVNTALVAQARQTFTNTVEARPDGPAVIDSFGNQWKVVIEERRAAVLTKMQYVSGIGGGNKQFYSTDGGKTWRQVSGYQGVPKGALLGYDHVTYRRQLPEKPKTATGWGAVTSATVTYNGKTYLTQQSSTVTARTAFGGTTTKNVLVDIPWVKVSTSTAAPSGVGLGAAGMSAANLPTTFGVDRIRAKLSHRLPLTVGEKAWMNRYNRVRAYAAQSAGRTFGFQTDEVGMGSWLSSAVKKVARSVGNATGLNKAIATISRPIKRVATAIGVPKSITGMTAGDYGKVVAIAGAVVVTAGIAAPLLAPLGSAIVGGAGSMISGLTGLITGSVPALTGGLKTVLNNINKTRAAAGLAPWSEKEFAAHCLTFKNQNPNASEADVVNGVMSEAAGNAAAGVGRAVDDLNRKANDALIAETNRRLAAMKEALTLNNQRANEASAALTDQQRRDLVAAGITPPAEPSLIPAGFGTPLALGAMVLVGVLGGIFFNRGKK